LQPIETPNIPFATIGVDFVVSLPESPERYTALLTVTDKFSKFVRLIPGKDADTATTWAGRFFNDVFKLWGLPSKIISDRDPRFTSSFWRALFRKCRVDLGMTAAYHPQADGQAERTNQTVETALRCLLVGKYVQTWSKHLGEVEYALNTSMNEATGTSPFKLLYGVEPVNPMLPVPRSENPGADHFLEERIRVRQDVADSIKLAQARMAIQFDAHHSPITLAGTVFIKMVRGTKVGYRLPESSSLATIKVGPFRILEKVGRLAYRLDLPPEMKIHPVISVVHLEQCLDDPFRREMPKREAIIIDGREHHVVDRILRMENRGRGNTWYLVR
jgi:hypothetical protein